MKSKKITYYMLIATALVLVACVRSQQSRQVVSEAMALELGRSEFSRTGRTVDNYNVNVEADSSGHKWLVWFDKKGLYAIPGGKHLVTIEKTTGRAIFLPGE